MHVRDDHSGTDSQWRSLSVDQKVFNSFRMSRLVSQFLGLLIAKYLDRHASSRCNISTSSWLLKSRTDWLVLLQTQKCFEDLLYSGGKVLT